MYEEQRRVHLDSEKCAIVESRIHPADVRETERNDETEYGSV